MKKKVTVPAPKKKMTKVLLPVQFTEAELQAIGLQLAATHQHIGELTVQKKTEADRFKDLIETSTAEAGRLAANRINGYEHRYVDCEITYDFEKGMKQTIRLDLVELVSEEPMRDEERQLALAAIDTVTEESDLPRN